MRRLRRAPLSMLGLNPFVVLADLSVNLVLVLLFYALGWTLNSSKALELWQLQARQTAVEQALQGQFPGELQQGQVRLEVDGNLQRIHFSDNILFDSGRAELKDRGQQMLARLCQVLLATGNRYDTIHIEGHTDNVPIWNSGFHSNWELSSARATAVVEFFQTKGVDPGRLVAAGYGEYRPVARNDSPYHKSLNRRIDIVLAYSQLQSGAAPATAP